MIMFHVRLRNDTEHDFDDHRAASCFSFHRRCLLLTEECSRCRTKFHVLESVHRSHPNNQLFVALVDLVLFEGPRISMLLFPFGVTDG